MYATGFIEKGEMKDNQRHGSWDFYFPESDEGPGYWFKHAYENGRKVGLHKFRWPDGTMEEANYVDGKLQGQYEIKYANQRIEKGLMEDNKRHGTWEFYYPGEDQ